MPPRPPSRPSLIAPAWSPLCWLLAVCLRAGAAEGGAPAVVLMIAEDEYDTRTTLP